MATSPQIGIVITGDSTQLMAAAAAAQKKIATLGDSVKQFGALMPGIGAGIAAAFAANNFRGAIDMMDQLDDMAEKTGITVEALSKLRYAGETVGTSTEQLGGGLKKLAKIMAEAAGGSEDANNIFKTIGVTFKDTAGNLRPTEAVLSDLAERFASFEDGPAKAALAMKVFGKSGEDMIPILNLGAAGLAASADEAKRLGIELGGDTARAAADFNDNMKRLSLTSEAAGMSLMNNLLPSLNAASQELLAGIKNTNGLIDAIVTLGTINPFKTQASNMATYRQELEELGKARDKYLARGWSTAAFDADIADLTKKLNYLKELQLAAAMATGGAVGDDAVSRRFMRAPIKMPAPIVKEPGKAPKAVKEPKEPRQSDYADNYINSLSTQYANLTGSMSKLDEVQRMLGVSGDKFNDIQKAQVKALAEQIDQYKAKQFLDENERKNLELLSALQERSQEAYDNNLMALKSEADALKDYAGWLGKSAQEVEKLRFEKELSAKVAKAESQVLDDQTKGLIEQAEATRRLAAIKRFANQSREGFDAVQADELDRQENAQRGVNEALKDYKKESENAGVAAYNATRQVVNGLEDSLTNAIIKGKLDFKSLTDFIISEVVRLQIVKPMLTSIFEPPAKGAPVSFMSDIFGTLFSANGNAFGPSGVIPFAKGGVVTRPTMFPFAKGTGIMGEAGPEAIMPLGRDNQGRLGVRGGGGNVQVNIINNAGASVTQTQRQQGDTTFIDVMVNQIEDRMAGNVAAGSGSLFHAMGNTFGMKRAVT